MRLTAADHAQVADAIRAAERRTDGEVLVVATPASDAYHDVVLHWALLLALFPPALAAAWPDGLLRAAELVDPAWEAGASLRGALILLLIATVLAFLLGR